MNGDEIKAIYEQLDERGKQFVETVALAELKHTREGLYLPHSGLLVANLHNLPLTGQNDEIEGRDDKIERTENAVR